MVEPAKIFNVKQKVCWAIFGVLHLVVSVLMIVSLTISNWYYTEWENYEWKGSLREVTSGPLEGKGYTDLAEDYCDLETDYWPCRMYAGLAIAMQVYTSGVVISLFCIVVSMVVLALYLRNVRCLALNFVTSYSSCCCYMFAYLSLMGYANIGSDCSGVEEIDEHPTICGDSALELGAAITALVIVLWIFFTVVLCVAVSNEKRIRNIQDSGNFQENPPVYRDPIPYAQAYPPQNISYQYSGQPPVYQNQYSGQPPVYQNQYPGQVPVYQNPDQPTVIYEPAYQPQPILKNPESFQPSKQ